MKISAMLLGLPFVISSVAAAPATRAVTFMGVSLGKPLNLPACRGGAVKEVCKIGPAQGDQWKIAVPRALKPPYVLNFTVRVLDGVVEEMQISTATGQPQSDVIEDLKLKFGKADTAVMLPDGFRESWNVPGGGQ